MKETSLKQLVNLMLTESGYENGMRSTISSRLTMWGRELSGEKLAVGEPLYQLILTSGFLNFLKMSELREE